MFVEIVLIWCKFRNKSESISYRSLLILSDIITAEKHRVGTSGVIKFKMADDDWAKLADDQEKQLLAKDVSSFVFQSKIKSFDKCLFDLLYLCVSHHKDVVEWGRTIVMNGCDHISPCHYPNRKFLPVWEVMLSMKVGFF